MRKLSVFNMMSLDGFISDRHGDMNWAHRQDAEWAVFAGGNASGDGTLLFGRVTYELMVKYWPTRDAARDQTQVAAGMNRMEKLVFSRTLKSSPWAGTQILGGDPATEVKALKAVAGSDMVILGSASIAAQLAETRLIDEYQIAIIPIALGGGKTMFDGMSHNLELKLTYSRVFSNGNVFVKYERA